MTKSQGTVHDEIGDDDPGPCPGCTNFSRCRSKLIACASFAAFVRRDRNYLTAARYPAVEIYRAVYG